MSFAISKVTVAAAVSNGGTLTFAYPALPASGIRFDNYGPFQPAVQVQAGVVVPAYQTGPGDYKLSSPHVAFSTGNQARFVNGVDFTLTFNVLASGVTFTYQGQSTIPVGSVVSLQLEMVGQNDGAPFKDDSRVANGALSPVNMLRLGAPVALSTTGILATTAVADILLHALATPIVLDVPRGLSIVSSTTDTTQSITIRGFDEFGAAMTETIALNGAAGVSGKKAWKTVVSYQANIAMAGNLSIGWTNVLGLPALLIVAGYLFLELLNNSKNANAGTILAGVSGAVATATTGDVRGTYTPSTTLPNGSNSYEVGIIAPDPRLLGLAQFAG